MSEFGDYLRAVREKRREDDRRFSVRQVAARVGVEPSYLSKVERGQQPPPSERTIALLADELGQDPDVLLALAGKVSGDLQSIIRGRPQLFAELLRQLKDAPDQAVFRLVREVRDGNW
ncbi:MAG: helix-turn-helix transcriptional regulator [Fuerstiella sp.]|jgi:transcriptional regulator with XRE-family HTH domain